MKTKLIAALVLFFASFALNMAMPLLLGLPFKWMWNLTLTPVFGVQRLDYFHSLAFLWLITVVRVAVAGVKLSATLKYGTEV
jgi:hypothetical protein